MHDSAQWCEAAARLRRQGSFAEAVDACRAALAQHPDDARVWNELAHALRFMDRTGEAREAAERALQLQPDYAPAWFNLGATLEARGDAARGTAAYRKALELQPDFAEAWSNLGGILGAQGQVREAIEAYRRALAVNPQLAPVWSNLGNALLDAGEVAAAADACARAVEVDPGDAAAWNNLGTVRLRAGEVTAALEAFHRALALAPQSVEVWTNLWHALRGQTAAAALVHYERVLAAAPEHVEALFNRGNLLQSLGRYDEALAAYDRAIKARPGYAEALNNRANVLQDLGRHEEALADYEKAVAAIPDRAEIHFNCGISLQALNRQQAALARYEKALAITPDAADVLNNHGNALEQLKRHDEALASYDKALQARPDYAEAHYNRGVALESLKRFDEALASYDRAIVLRADYAEALNNRGNVLQERGQLRDALAGYESALTIRPNDAVTLNNRGNALLVLGRTEDALASYDAALAIRPRYCDALNGRANALDVLGRYAEAAETCGRLAAVEPDHPYARGHFLYMKLNCCEWTNFAADTALIAEQTRAGRRATAPLTFVTVSDSARDQLVCARTIVNDKYPQLQQTARQSGARRHDRMRIAYVSADFREHPVANLTARLFELHDRKRFEIFGISLGPAPDSPMRRRLKSAFDGFHDAGAMADAEVAALLHKLEIDIAVDLMGHTGHSRMGIWAHRLAPIQVNYLGYPGTSGADYMDYILADRFVIPEAHQPHYSERVVYLPDSFLVNDATQRIAERTPTRAQAGLPAQGFVFCSFNNACKILPATFSVWMRLLQRIDGSVLWLRRANASAEKNLRREAQAAGVDPDRLVFAPRTKLLEEHLARHRLAGLFLDTLPYNAHTTASDALWAGLPVLTCAGETFAGRVAGSLLNAVGLPELITSSFAEYEALAIKLATDERLLSGFRARLDRNRTTQPLFDTDRFRCYIEAAFTTMWQRYQNGLAPAGFAVPATYNSKTPKP